MTNIYAQDMHRILLEMAGNGWKCREISGNGWKGLDVAGNGLKQLEWVEMAGYGRKWLVMD